MRKSVSTLFIVPLIRADVLQYPEKNTAAEKTTKVIHLWQVQGFVWLQTSSQLSVKLGSGRNSKLICELLPCSWQKTPPWIGMSRHVQRQSWKLVGSAQHGSEHPNRQLLASSFLALCLIFLRVFLFPLPCPAMCSSSVRTFFHPDARQREAPSTVNVQSVELFPL